MRTTIGIKEKDKETKEIIAKQDNTDKKKHVHCPVCGSKLVRSKQSVSEMDCFKCHNTIGILVWDDIVTVVDKKAYSGKVHKEMLTAYVEKLQSLLE